MDDLKTSGNTAPMIASPSDGTHEPTLQTREGSGLTLDLKPDDIAYPRGLEIAVEGFAGDCGGARPAQVFMEVYDRKLRIYIWTGESEDPAVSVEIEPAPAERAST